MKKGYFFIDDVIWCLRDLTRQKPASLFDNPYFKMLKEAYDKYGVKTTLNVFYRTDYAYGYDEFTLADVTDAYKAEFEAASGWLKFSFHAKEEFPDYPHVNASYEDTYKLFKDIEREIFRFAGEKSITYAITPHWLPMSKDAVRALRDCGVKLINSSFGEVGVEYNGDPNSLPYGHAFRLLQNRKPETKVFTRKSRDVAITRSICGYNHIDEDDLAAQGVDFSMIHNQELDVYFKHFSNPCLNLIPYEEIEGDFAPFLDNPYLGIANHEEYFYSDYCGYQPDYADKIFKMGEIMKKNGFEFFFIEDLVADK